MNVIDHLKQQGFPPLIAFCNRLSGNGDGVRVLEELRAVLHPAVVYDLFAKGSIERELNWLTQLAAPAPSEELALHTSIESTDDTERARLSQTARASNRSALSPLSPLLESAHSDSTNSTNSTGNISKLIVLVCGGDGSISYAMSVLEKINPKVFHLI